MKYTQKQLEKDLSFWQKELRLQDWKINAFLVNSAMLEDPKWVGSCRVTQECKQATIKVMDLDSWIAAGYKPEKYDPEDVLLHELFHIHFEFSYNFVDSEDRKHYTLGLEQAFESITPALLQLKRAAKQKSKSARKGKKK